MPWSPIYRRAIGTQYELSRGRGGSPVRLSCSFCRFLRAYETTHYLPRSDHDGGRLLHGVARSFEFASVAAHHPRNGTRREWRERPQSVSRTRTGFEDGSDTASSTSGRTRTSERSVDLLLHH